LNKESKSTFYIQSLKDFPMIARAFVKANSRLPSSVIIVKRPFSVVGMILIPLRCKTSDKLFDKMVLEESFLV